jgi:hypothetical protein
MLINEDFPTLERPIKAYSGILSLGAFITLLLLIINSADLTFIKDVFFFGI